MKLSFTDNFIHKLRTLIGRNIEVFINQNRRIFITFNPKTQKISLHKIFLQAPRNVLEALCGFITEKNNIHYKKFLKNYIDSCEKSFSYHKELICKRELSLQNRGIFYDLNDIYKRLNEKYFNNNVEAKISWFGRLYKSKRSSRTLGIFHNDFQLIQIHKCLDCKKVPKFFIEYVVYHEMLHYFFPITMNAQGRRIIHSPSFKEKERCFEKYLEARLWETKNKHILFN